VPKIEVSFDIDVNGILMVKAKDNSTGSEQSITIEGSSRLADDDIERMVKEAETFATADKERRENINLKNEADSLAYQASKQLETLGDKISADEKKEIEDVLAELKANIESDNIEQLKISVKTLEEKLAVFLSQNGVGPDGVGVTPDTPTDDGVVDSEIKDV
jgi:molecular chaperone DnaK